MKYLFILFMFSFGCASKPLSKPTIESCMRDVREKFHLNDENLTREQRSQADIILFMACESTDLDSVAAEELIEHIKQSH